MNEWLESMIGRLNIVSHLKTDKYGLIRVKFTRKALEEIIDYLEELKALRVGLEKNSKELEETKNELKVTRKAFELACRKAGECDCCLTFDGHTCDNYCGTHFQEYFLQKARIIDHEI